MNFNQTSMRNIGMRVIVLKSNQLTNYTTYN
jgi:hypothetical protein